MEIKSIIFDFDGVLVNSMKIKDAAFREIVKQYTKKQQHRFIQFHRRNLGVSRIIKFRYLKKNILKEKFSNKDISDLSKKFTKLVFEKIIDLRLNQGLLKFIKKNFKKYKFYISSGTPEIELKKIFHLKNINFLFRKIYGSPKTKSQHIKKIMKNNKFKNNNLIFVGDGLSDYKAANSCKINFVQVGDNFNKKSIKYKIKFNNNIEKIIKKLTICK